ncbi:MAG: hypothetical protein V2I33_02005, partial [Kangiellaceae bacterium]|nr:hypothetical protein [Kangiellaceae bacterium]
MSRAVLTIICIPFFLIGGLFLYNDFNYYVLRADVNANDTGLHIGRIKARATEVERYLEQTGKLPTSKLLNCDWKLCEENFFWIWHIFPSEDNGYRLEFTKMSN